MINQATLLGNVGADPETRTLNNGDPVSSFSLATSERWTDKQSGEQRERTEWHRVVVYNPTLAEVVRKHVVKGARIFIQGQIRGRKYERDGQDVYVTEIVLDRVGAVLKLLGDARHDHPHDGRRQDGRDDRQGGGKPTASSRNPNASRQREPGDEDETGHGYSGRGGNGNGNGGDNGRRRRTVPPPIEDDEIPF